MNTITLEGSTPSETQNSSIKLAPGESKENEIYFMILYQRKEKEKSKEFIFTKYDKEPKIIYSKEIEGKGEGKNKIYLYQKVFKLKKKPKKTEENQKKGHSSKKKEDEKNQKEGADDKKKEDKKKEDKKKEDKKKDDKKKSDKKKDEKKNEEEIEIQFEIGKDSYIITFNLEDKFFYYDVELKKGNKFLTNIAKEVIECNNIFLASLCFINISGKINLKEFFKKKIKKIGSKKIH